MENNIYNIAEGKKLNKELSIIHEQEVLGKEFKVYGDVDNPLFLAKDVAEWIEHTNATMMLRAIDENEKVLNIVYTLGGNQKTTFLTEFGLYEVLMQSRKPIAKAFKNEVKQILHDVRRHGMYATPEFAREALKDPTFLYAAMEALTAEREENQKLKHQAVLNAPKIQLAEAIESSEDSILVGELAKILGQNGVAIGPYRLFEWLRENDYLMKRGESWNMPTQKSIDADLLEIKETTYITNGKVRVYKTPKVTGKGQLHFINLFAKEFISA